MSQAPRCEHGGAERGLLCEQCHPKGPLDEYAAKRRDSANLEEWNETMRAQRRLELLVIGFWVGIAALVWVAHRNWLAILDFVFPGK